MGYAESTNQSSTKQPDRRRKPTLRVAVCSLIAVLIAWQVGIRQLSKSMLEANDAVTALRVDPHSSLAQSALAASELRNGHVATSSYLAAGALRSTVLSPVALRSLMIAKQPTGNAATSRDLALTAGRLGWRDQGTQIALFDLDVQAGRMSDAADRLDAIGRTTEQASLIFPIIDSWLPSDDFKRDIAARLSRNPPWRGSYLTSIREVDRSAVMARQQLAIALPHRDRDQERTELSPYVYWLLDQGYFAGAYDLWRGHLARRMITNSRLYDASFRGAGQSGPALPFEWNLRTLDGASAVAVQDDRGVGLEVETDGTAEGDLVEQRLVLPAGSYRFTVDMDSASERALEAFQWKISCGPARTPIFGRDLTSTKNRRQPNGVKISFLFDVPSDKCPLQFVDLYLSRPSDPESMVAFFTDARFSNPRIETGSYGLLMRC